jgi:membrane fusion protein
MRMPIRQEQDAELTMDDSNQRDSMSVVPTPGAGENASAGLRLFRSEVLAERQTQWLGTVMIAPRASFRLFTLLAIAATAAIVALLALGEFTRTARVNGWLVPQQGVVRVYAPRPGIVSSLDVTEGAEVRKGDRLLALSDELRSTTLGATQAQITQRLSERSASLVEERTQARRLLAQQQRALVDRAAALKLEQEQLQRDIDLLQQRVAIAERNEALHREQYTQGYISDMRLQQVQAELIEQRARLGAAERARLVAIRERMAVEAERADLPLKVGKEIALLDRGIAELQQERAEAEARREIVVSAPHDGTVTAIHAVAGAKADAGAPLLSIVPPATRLEAHLYGPSRSIGFVRPGQHVQLRYQAFPYQRFGHQEGVIANVSRTAISPGELPPPLAGLTSLTGSVAATGAEPIYRITVDLMTQSVDAYGEQMPLQSGMALEADIALEKRRLFEWVLEPLYTVTGLRG